MTLLYQNEQIRQLEALVYRDEDLSPYSLMQRAGEVGLELIEKRFADKASIAICCGKGNNGGDGFVLARLLHLRGRQVVVYIAPTDKRAETASLAFADCINAGCKIIEYGNDRVFTEDLIVDALLGIGLKDELREPYATMISKINLASAPIIALDVPSGLNSDTGAVCGQAVNATLTLTFIALKQGLYTAKAAAHCGEIIVNDLNISNKLLSHVDPTAELIDANEAMAKLPHRKADSHKGDHGHVLVIGGDYGMGGAVRMAAESALRAGAGLVTVATRPEHISIVSGPRPELMCHQVVTADDLQPLLDKADVVVIGPGLGQSDWSKQLLALVVKSYHKKVLDADALNLLSQSTLQAEDWVLTPHPGEAGRLLDCTTAEIQEDRYLAAREIITRYHGVVALKGAGTIIASKGVLPLVCPAGNPGMATAGMGDILSGLIGGLLAQGMRCADAAVAGVSIHSAAADLASKDQGERGLLATDLLDYIRQLVNSYAD